MAHDAKSLPPALELGVNVKVGSPTQTGTNPIRRGSEPPLGRGEDRGSLKERGSRSCQGCFLEEGALETGLAFSSVSVPMVLAPWELSVRLGVRSCGSFWPH